MRLTLAAHWAEMEQAAPPDLNKYARKTARDMYYHGACAMFRLMAEIQGNRLHNATEMLRLLEGISGELELWCSEDSPACSTDSDGRPPTGT